MNISYLIAVHNEHLELKRLLDQLFQYLSPEDEIIIQGDQGKVTDEVVSVIRPRLKDNRVKYIEFPLNKDFSKFKNNLLKQATKEYSFLIDADELLHPNLISNVKLLLEANPDIEMFILPRFNVVNGLTFDYAKSQNWRVNELFIDNETVEFLNLESNLATNVVNFNDPQERLFKTNENLRFEGKVHERIKGYQTYSILRTPTSDGLNPFIDLSWCILHIKDFERQKNQNNFYKKIN